MESGFLEALVLGAMLGMRHALDADHVVAVSTLVSEYRNPFRALWVGASWGLGHTTSLVVAGLALLALGSAMPQGLASIFELLVGVMLIFLGLQVLHSWWQKRAHLHPHEHESYSHGHFHSHQEMPEHRGHHLPLVGRPFFRLKSYLVGLVHGLAGSAALMLLALTTLDSMWAGFLYILVFGLGSILAMGFITIFLSVPFVSAARLPALYRSVQAMAGVSSVLFGVLLIYEVGLRGGLL